MQLYSYLADLALCDVVVGRKIPRLFETEIEPPSSHGEHSVPVPSRMGEAPKLPPRLAIFNTCIYPAYCCKGQFKPATHRCDRLVVDHGPHAAVPDHEL